MTSGAVSGAPGEAYWAAKGGSVRCSGMYSRSSLSPFHRPGALCAGSEALLLPIIASTMALYMQMRFLSTKI